MFALLEHETCQGTHWDLLVELPGAERLATWRLAASPLEAPLPLPAERIAEHRPLYLHYEGPISGGRGSVRRLDRGPSAARETGDRRVEVALAGRHLRGRFELPAAPGHAGRMARLEH